MNLLFFFLIILSVIIFHIILKKICHYKNLVDKYDEQMKLIVETKQINHQDVNNDLENDLISFLNENNDNIYQDLYIQKPKTFYLDAYDYKSPYSELTNLFNN